jgi:NitT/TauT family transport system permease protein
MSALWSTEGRKLKTTSNWLIVFTRVAILTTLLAAWQIAASQSTLTRFFIGSPYLVASTIFDWFVSGEIYRHLYVTLLETFLAFATGTTMALVVGLWLGLSTFWSRALDPFIKSLNTMPRLILAPIFTIWFGLGISSKVALGTVTVFFIVFFNVFNGVRDVSPVLLANVRMLGASHSQLIRRVYIPSAMTWVFSSLHLSVGMAFVAAVVGEYLGSAQGVGYLILQAETTFEMHAVLAGILILTTCALLLDALVTVVESHLLAWRRSNR